jgi:hypothetical protein
MPKKQNKSELVKQIEAYGLKNKLADLAKKDEQRRPFRHLPRQFSKGILIGNIAIVPKKIDSSRFVYVIADMVEAKVLYNDVNLKQTAILTAHYLAEGKPVPRNILLLDDHFASKIFEIRNFKRFLKQAQQDKDERAEFVYENKLRETNRLADAIKQEIQLNFDATFRMNFAK